MHDSQQGVRDRASQPCSLPCNGHNPHAKPNLVDVLYIVIQNPVHTRT